MNGILQSNEQAIFENPFKPTKMGNEVLEHHTTIDGKVESLINDYSTLDPNSPQAQSNIRELNKWIEKGLKSDDPKVRAEAEKAKQKAEAAGVYDPGSVIEPDDPVEAPEIVEDNPSEEGTEGGDGGDGGTGGGDGGTGGGSTGGGGGGSTGGGGSSTQVGGSSGAGVDATPNSPFLDIRLHDPLVIDLDADGIELISLEDSNAYFDLNMDGFAELTGWVSSDDGFLVLDKNDNGIIDDKSEHFGDTDGFSNGFENLASYDDNGDGVINEQDTIFTSLQIWQDFNEDGITDVGELSNLAAHQISSISLNAEEVLESNSGHLISHTSNVQFENGETQLLQAVNFNFDPVYSQAILPEDFEYVLEAYYLPGTVALINGFGEFCPFEVKHATQVPV